MHTPSHAGAGLGVVLSLAMVLAGCTTSPQREVSAPAAERSVPAEQSAVSPSAASPSAAVSPASGRERARQSVERLCAEVDEARLEGAALVSSQLGTGAPTRAQLEAGILRLQSLASELRAQLTPLVRAPSDPELAASLEALQLQLEGVSATARDALQRLRTLSEPQLARVGPLLAAGVAQTASALERQGLPACAGLVLR